MSIPSYASSVPKSFLAYPGSDFDLESGTIRRIRKPKSSQLHPVKMLKSFGNRVRYFYKLHPFLAFLISLSFGITILVIISIYQSRYSAVGSYREFDVSLENYPFANLKNLVMVAGHSIYTSKSCEKVDKEDSWFLEPYQKNPGQAATFLAHIEQGIEITAKDEMALLLFSGGETRKDAGPRSEAQSYWAVAESRGWFGKEENVRSRALTEEHARDSFENLLFSVCRFRELTGRYPSNITVSSLFHKSFLFWLGELCSVKGEKRVSEAFYFFLKLRAVHIFDKEPLEKVIITNGCLLSTWSVLSRQYNPYLKFSYFHC